jgi:hypothetical protein
MKSEFELNHAANVFTPHDLVGLARPGTGVANDLGDLVLVPVSKWSFEEKKFALILTLRKRKLSNRISGTRSRYLCHL